MNQPQRVPLNIPLLDKIAERKKEKEDERKRREVEEQERKMNLIMQKWENLTFAIYTRAVINYDKLNEPKEELTELLKKCAIAASAADSMWGIELGVGGKAKPVTPVED